MPLRDPGPTGPWLKRTVDAIPPPGLVLLAIAAIQSGAGIATHLFPALGADGTVAVLIIFSALLLALAGRGRLRSFAPALVRNWRLLGAFGVCIAAMNLFFFEAIARIPLGVAVAFEFIGPLGVAAFTSRRASHVFWVALAACGIVLLFPVSGADLDPVGIGFALTAGVGWACFILLARRVGRRLPGNDGLTIAMIIAAVTMLPLVAPVTGVLLADPWLLLIGLGVALLSTSIPFTLEFRALQRLSTRTCGVLVSLEPAVAALVGAVLLQQHIGTRGMVAVGCVVAAAIAVTLSDRSRSQPAG